MHEFFSFDFPLREYFFCTSTATPRHPRHKFSNGPSLNTGKDNSIKQENFAYRNTTGKK